jgi:hypothetical protein
MVESALRKRSRAAPDKIRLISLRVAIGLILLAGGAVVAVLANAVAGGTCALIGVGLLLPTRRPGRSSSMPTILGGGGGDGSGSV